MAANKDSTAARLALGFLPGVGPKKVLRSFEIVGSETLSPRELIAAATGGDVADDEFSQVYETAWRIMNDSQEAGIRVLPYDDPDYPTPLKAIPDPPPFLYARGQLPEWDEAVAVIGTRHPDELALDFASKTVQGLASSPGAVVVSGLALGIDTRAHEQALSQSLRTVAILANGLDTVYPKANAALAENILESGGVLLSEIPMGQRVTSFNLVARDRLQSGLSLATILVQSSLDGGSMHTARFALEQNRFLVACRPLADSEAWSGNAFLTRPVASIDWGEVPSKLRRFQKLQGNRKSLAFRVSAESIEEFMVSGIAKRFIPASKDSTKDDPSNEPFELTLGLDF